MSADVYEIAGTVDTSARDHIHGEDVVLVEQEDEAVYLIARPKNGGED